MMRASLDWKKVSEEWISAKEHWSAVRRWMAAETEARLAGKLGPDEGYSLDRVRGFPRPGPPRPECRKIQIPWDELDGEEWVVLLSLHPARAEFCDWSRLNGENWVDLLTSRPEFAKKCPWEKLDGKAWRRLLVMRPQFAEHCRWEKLGEEEWERLLTARPELEAYRGDVVAGAVSVRSDADAMLERFRAGLSASERLAFAGAAGRRMIPEGTRMGAWTVGGFLGRGGSAEVYCARHRRLGTSAALKVLWREKPQPKARFLREVRFLARRPGASFPTFLGSGESAGRAWMALELLEAYPLPSEDEEVARYLLEVGAAVEALHAAGWLHRDIKPGNILRRADGHAVLADLGLLKQYGKAKATGKGSGVARSTVSVVDGRPVGVGTPGYAAPEQFDGGEATPATDVYALGILGDACFGGASARELGGDSREGHKRRSAAALPECGGDDGGDSGEERMRGG